jgi:serine/threonine-protein phosphatase 2B regulatory subunit
VSSEETWLLFDSFLKIDADWSGAVDLQELCQYFDIPETRFTARIFASIDEDESGQLDFVEYVLGIYNICTMDAGMLSNFVFDVVDVSHVGFLTAAQLDAILRLLYDVPSVDGNPELQRMLEAADSNGDGVVDRDELRALLEAHPAAYQPLLRIQSALQSKTMGVPWWRQAQRARFTRFPGTMPVREMLVVHDRLRDRDQDEVMLAQMRLERHIHAAAMREAESSWKRELVDKFKAMGEKEQEYEYALLRSRAVLEEAREMRRVVAGEMLFGTCNAAKLLADKRMAIVLRRRENLLEHARTLLGPAIDEQRDVALRKCREECGEEAQRRETAFPDVKARIEVDTRVRLDRYRAYVHEGGKGFSAIPEASFEAVGGASSQAAARHAAMEALAEEIFEERKRSVYAEMRRKLEEQLASLDAVRNRLFLDVDIDDSFVDLRVWQRRWNPAEVCYEWVNNRNDHAVRAPPHPDDAFP